MSGASSEAVAILSFLLPGLVAVAVFHMFTSHPRPSEFAMKNIYGLLLALALAITLAGCVTGSVEEPEVDQEQVVAELRGRSFRQFVPSVDASPRKAVVLDFHGGVQLRAQYSRDNRAVNEWEIAADDYRVEGSRGGSEVTIYFNDPRSAQQFPDRCEDCIPSSGFSISIRNVFDREKISFKLNDLGNTLPPPFPVFESWTKFREDEIFD